MRNLPIALLLAASFIGSGIAHAQDPYKADRERWLRIAEQCMPELNYEECRPVAVVKPVKDDSAYLGWRYEKVCDAEEFLSQEFNDVKEVTLDFGRHMTGYCTFRIKTLKPIQDAPIRLKLFFGEVPSELNYPLEPWEGGARGWLQDETVTAEFADTDVIVPRRVSFRYLKIQVLATTTNQFRFALDVKFRAQTSAGPLLTTLEPGCPKEIADINRVSVATLRECMQTVYEDGPKRDRRLWIGDMYLEYLANRYSFRDANLVKRCLYLFAGTAREDGQLSPNVFEVPSPRDGADSYLMPYCLLYNSTLMEYLNDTGDYETANDLWKVAYNQMEGALRFVDGRGVFNRDLFDGDVWLFQDWRKDLDSNAPMQGAVIFGLDQSVELARMLGHGDEVKHWEAMSKKMKEAARKYLYDKKRGVFLSGPDRQLSVLGQVWLVKAGVLSQKEARKAITTALSDPDSVFPGTPYATHYLIEAMLLSGMNDEARDYLVKYWGGMVKEGADTFWECYATDSADISSLGLAALNSYCHAWSSTPVYFIHKYPEVFQR